jgi:prophage regulatory protein
MDLKIIKLPKVMEMTSFSVASIYRLCAEGKFPKKIKIGARSVGWRESDIVEYIEERERNS